MKNLILGLVLGIALSAGAVYFIAPKLKQAEYDKGFGEGNKAGIAKGTALGIDKGIAQGVAEEKDRQKPGLDSMASVIEKEQEALSRARRKPVKVEKKVQNWRVLGGSIQEPIPEETGK